MDEFQNNLKYFGIELNSDQGEKLLRFYELLIKKNEVMNLTAITDFNEVLSKHYLDSLSVSTVIELKDQSVIDLGTGGGFPGIPLKIVFPDLRLILADSLNKRVNFLKETISELGLDDIDAIHGRAEELGREDDLREAFDICVSRAVARLSVLSEYCLPFVKKGGVFVSYKSEDADIEVKEAEKAISLLGGKVREVKSFILPGTEFKRSLIVIEKIKNTPRSYPRRAGVPKKDPL